MASQKVDETRPDLELISAVKQFDVDKVKSILRSTPNIEEVMNSAICTNGRFNETTTALLEACKGIYRLGSRDGYDFGVGRFLEIVQHLLDNGADPTITGGHLGRILIPFHFAVASGNLTLIKKLLVNGNGRKAEVNQINHDGQSALHMYCEHSKSDMSHSEILTTLIEHQVDVNQQDKNGKTPLHISCARKRHGLTMMLLRKGALATMQELRELQDHRPVGDCPLHIAALEDSRTMIDMVELCLAEPRESMELIIEALELTAVYKSCPDPFECMRKATQLRTEHNIKKRIFEPMDCYGFIKEWETIEELEAYRGDEKQLKLQAVLARERIHQGKNEKLMELIHEKLISDILKASRPKSKAGKLLEHHFLWCCKGKDNFLKVVMTAWKKELEGEFESFDTESVVKLIKFTIECLTDKRIDDDYFMTFLSTVTTVLMKLFRRNRPVPDVSKDEQMIARELLKELLDKVPMPLDEDDEKHPLQHLITTMNFRLPNAGIDIFSYTPYDYELMNMLLVSKTIQLGVVDTQGNTILHSAVESIDADVQDSETKQILCQGLINHSIPAINLLLEKGVYPNARNRKYETAQDMLRYEGEDAEDDPIEVAYTEIRDLLQQYEDWYSMTLRTKAAVAVSGLPCRDHLKGHCPDGLIDFVNLHGDPNNIEEESDSDDSDDSGDSGDSGDSIYTLGKKINVNFEIDDITGEAYVQHKLRESSPDDWY